MSIYHHSVFMSKSFIIIIIIIIIIIELNNIYVFIVPRLETNLVVNYTQNHTDTVSTIHYKVSVSNNKII